MKTEEFLKGILEQAEAATPGPWTRSNHYGYKIVTPKGPYGVEQTITHVELRDGRRGPMKHEGSVAESSNGSNGDFIAASRINVPLLASALLDVLHWADWLEEQAAAFRRMSTRLGSSYEAIGAYSHQLAVNLRDVVEDALEGDQE